MKFSLSKRLAFFYPVLTLLGIALSSIIGAVLCEDVACDGAKDPLVETSTGVIAGRCSRVLDTDVSSFLGIPFAKPPVGERRFSKAEPIDSWEGTLSAKEKPTSCVQFSSRNFSWIPSSVRYSEDCLFLNVWTPGSDSEKFPVMVWIHGGGYYSGSSSMDAYDGSALAAHGKVVVVSINYRLGLFGFFNGGTPEAPGNVGLYDQVLALQWIKANAQKFGGDAQKITLFGQSAGAMSISLHLVSPLSRGLFNRAIMQSGTAYHPHLNDDITVSIFKSNKFAEVVGCSDSEVNLMTRPSEVIGCLKTKNASDLAQIENIFTSRFPLYFAPYFGNKCEHCNDFLPESPIKMMSSAKEYQTSTLVGNNQKEGSIFLSYMMPDIFSGRQAVALSLLQAKEIIKGLFSTAPEVPPELVFDYYFRNLEDYTPGIVDAISNAFGDYVFVCPGMFLAERAESYSYWLTYRSTKDPSPEWMGATHFSEVPFVFGKPFLNDDGDKFTSDDESFSSAVIGKWIEFASNGSFEDSADVWTRFSKDNPVSYELDLSSEETHLKTFPRLEACEFWRPYFELQFS